MSPEVLTGKTKINSPAVDVWACGIMLFVMLTAKFPFDGSSSS
jgi:serine/threonine protein kinase